MRAVFDPHAPKKATNLSINSDLLRRARALDINLSATLERALAETLKMRQREQWLAQNASAQRARTSGGRPSVKRRTYCLAVATVSNPLSTATGLQSAASSKTRTGSSSRARAYWATALKRARDLSAKMRSRLCHGRSRWLCNSKRLSRSNSRS